ncbi:MAG: hypothetical protein MUO85_01165 [candidate division Zixibacteria bacterium]|nr:hypothetical protein [candidate division Zixibacteria bacterium]
MPKRRKNRPFENEDKAIGNFLGKLIRKIISKLELSEDYEIKVSDALRAIQLKEQMKPTQEVEKIFWGLIEQIRKEELEKQIQK